MKILLVEDARAVVTLLTIRLQSYGHEVVHAADGAQGVEAFSQHAPDLVLMDIEMPVMNGFEATNRIRAAEAREQWAWTPIIFLTSSSTVDNLITAIEAGGDDFMDKSVPEPVLQARMKAMARIAALRQRLLHANQQLQSLADRDGLTGLPNRRSLDGRLDAAWQRALAEQRAMAVLMLDIDNFKKYNDHYGHAQGDDCLKAVACAIAEATEATNRSGKTRDAFAARYGGEEFTVVVPDAAPGAHIYLGRSITEAVRKLAVPHEKNAEWGVVTVSVGGVRLDRAQGDLASTFRKADALLYQAKENGRNRAELMG